MATDWHLSKTVTVGNMITMFFAILALVGSYYTLDKRIAILEDNHQDLATHLKDESINREKDVTRVCDRLDRIEDLLLDYIMKE